MIIILNMKQYAIVMYQITTQQTPPSMFKSIKLFGQFKGVPGVADRLKHLGIIQPSDQPSLVPMSGLSNLTFKVTCKSLPQPIVFKWYKDTFNMFVNRQLETEIVTLEAKAGRHPKVLYSDNDCRVQQYAEGISISETEVTQEMLLTIVTQLAVFSKECKPKLIKINDRRFDRLLVEYRKIFERVSANTQLKMTEKSGKMVQELLGENVITKIRKLLPNKMILSHNDVNMTNCIWNGQKVITLIDFEFASLNYLGFDIGNLLNEAATQYSDEFQIRPQWQIGQEQKKQLINRYFDTLGILHNRNERMHMVEVGRLMSHYFWMFIGVLSFEDKDCTLDLNYYIQRRYEQTHKYLKKLSS